MDRVSRVRPRQLPLRSSSARIGFPRSEEWFKPPGAIRRPGWSVDWDKCGAGPGCFHLIAGEVRGLARGDAAASGVSESPWDSTEERLARSIRYQCARSLGYPKCRHGRIVPAQRERDRVEVNRVIGPAQLAHAVSLGARSACAPPARAGDFA